MRTGPAIFVFFAFAGAARLVGACISDEKLPLLRPPTTPDAAVSSDAGDAGDAAASGDDGDDDEDAAPVPIVPGHLHVFATSSVHAGNVNIADAGPADTICNDLGKNAINAKSTFVAWLASSNGAALDRLGTDGPWYNTREILVGGRADLTKGLDHAIARDEKGNLVGLGLVDAGKRTSLAWTGLGADGVNAQNHCGLFTVNLDSNHGAAGDLNADDGAWTSSETAHVCNDELHLICFEKAAQ